MEKPGPKLLLRVDTVPGENPSRIVVPLDRIQTAFVEDGFLKIVMAPAPEPTPACYPSDLEALARDVREFKEWIFEATKPGSPYAEAIEALNS